MSVVVSQNIKASKDKIWEMITDIENAQKNISAILKINILNKPENGVVGLRWEETREMFGKKATETMWIEKAEEGKWYETTAHNCGCIYSTRIEISEVSGAVNLTMTFNSTPQTLVAKITTLIGLLFKGMIRKALEKDLRELKKKLESDGQ